jgi:PAS domain S-box-containing protein
VAVDQEQLIRGLLQLAESLSSGLPLEVRLTDLCRTTVQLLRCDRSSIFLREGRHYRAKFSHDNPPDLAPRFPRFKVSLRDPLISRAMETRSFVLLNDAQHSPLMNAQTARRAGIQSIVVAPLFDGRRDPLGFITAEYNENFGIFTEAMSTLVLGFAKLAELACLAHRHAAERERAEDVLRRSEERFRALIENSSDVILVVDAKATIVYASPSIEPVLGYKPAEVVGRSGYEIIVPADLPRAIRDFGGAIATKDVVIPNAFRVRHKDGSERILEGVGKSLLDHSAVAGFIMNVRDITGRKAAEAALRESEERFRALVDQAITGICVIQDDRFAYVNPRMAAVVGYQQDEMLRLPPIELFVEADRELFRENLRRRLSGEVSSVRYRFGARHKNGTKIEVEAYGNLITYNGRPAILSTLLDITERKRAEEAIQRERNFSDAVLNSLPGVFYILDHNLTFLRWNKNVEQTLGYTDGDIARMSPFDFVAAGDRELLQTRIEEVFAKGASDVEVHLFAKNGTRTPYYLTGLTTRIDGKLCLIGTGVDITERRRAEEALRRSLALSAMGSLVAGVAHEARNPLFGISATLDAFEARFGQQPEFAQYLAVLRGEANQLNDLMRDLLDYGRPPSPMFVSGSMATVIAEAVAACAPLARDANVHVAVTMAEGIAPLAMDVGRLPRAFQNLLQNAIQHSPYGGTVTVEAAEIRDDGGGWIECTVKDSGGGFREEDLPRQIFEPFFSHRQGGTGLGLSIVERVVEDHRGTVCAVNRPEGGAAVTIRLPAGA